MATLILACFVSVMFLGWADRRVSEQLVRLDNVAVEFVDYLEPHSFAFIFERIRHRPDLPYSGSDVCNRSILVLTNAGQCVSRHRTPVR